VRLNRCNQEGHFYAFTLHDKAIDKLDGSVKASVVLPVEVLIEGDNVVADHHFNVNIFECVSVVVDVFVRMIIKMILDVGVAQTAAIARDTTVQAARIRYDERSEKEKG